jgi:acyl-coenzyme A thioesterase PaaI-like protein
MTVADVAIYVAILGTIGIVPLAVTTSLTINFLRKPAAGKPIVGACRLMKVGRTLVVGEVALYSQGNAEIVAHEGMLKFSEGEVMVALSMESAIGI